MKKYKVVDISEKELEDLVRKYPKFIEEGLTYLDHQRKTERGPFDVLFVDSGNALVVAELKVVEDDGMLVQGLDYYNYITKNVEGFARAYKGKAKIDPLQKPRLFLIAPSFSINLQNRCKWIDIPISLFTFQTITFDNKSKEVIPIFKEITIPSRPQPVEIYTIKQKLNYITDGKIKKIVKNLLEEIKGWDKEKISMDAIRYNISIKISGRVFAYIGARRKHFIIYTNNNEDQWASYPIKELDDLVGVKELVKQNYEKLKVN